MTGFYAMAIAHFFADFVFQTEMMAKNKSSNNTWLLIHIIVYTITFGTIYYFLVDHVSLWSVVKWSALNGVAHFVIDYLTSRLSKYFWEKQKTRAFFIVIGADQTLHYLCFYYTISIV